MKKSAFDWAHSFIDAFTNYLTPGASKKTTSEVDRNGDSASFVMSESEGEPFTVTIHRGNRPPPFLDWDGVTGKVWLVWAFRKSEARIAAICTKEKYADHYVAVLPSAYPGFVLKKEQAILDHAFGQQDMQTLILGRIQRNTIF